MSQHVEPINDVGRSMTVFELCLCIVERGYPDIYECGHLVIGCVCDYVF